MKERGMKPKDLSSATGIASKHIDALLAGELEKLPPAPYLRGYLEKLGNVLDFDGSGWWNTLKEEGFAVSGAKDRLPRNRFIRSPGAPYAAGFVILVLVALYLVFRIPAIVGAPELTIQFPEAQFSETMLEKIVVRGIVERSDSVLINGDAAAVGDDGSFEKEVSLQEGMNTIEIRASKFLGRETVAIRQVLYSPPPPPAAPTQQLPATPITPTEPGVSQ